jgi:uncharacterized protein (DUF1778 family)
MDDQTKHRKQICKFRATEEEKQLFENNAILQGYSSLSEFMRITLQNACWNV